MANEEVKKVVYLLGAGASRNALPVVSEFSSALKAQQFWLKSAMGTKLDKLRFNDYVSKLDNLASESEKHGTIDTYARVLSMRGQSGELKSLKMHLAMFFILEQAVARKNWDPNPEVLHGRGYYSKRDLIDVRYMTWLAQIMDNSGNIDARIKVLSWNYDLQLEHAIGLYRGVDNLAYVHNMDTSWVYPSPDNVAYEDCSVTQHPSIVHLNGLAGLRYTAGKFGTLYADLLRENPRELIEGVFRLYLNHDREERVLLNAVSETFTFAWEDKRISNSAHQFAKHAIEQASVLVVIGYSFPAFNRTLDMELMHSFLNPQTTIPSERRIVLQNPTASESEFRHLFGYRFDIQKIQVQQETEQFYLPPELFNVT